MQGAGPTCRQLVCRGLSAGPWSVPSDYIGSWWGLRGSTLQLIWSLREMTESCNSHVKKTKVVDGVGGLQVGLAWEEKTAAGHAQRRAWARAFHARWGPAGAVLCSRCSEACLVHAECETMQGWSRAGERKRPRGCWSKHERMLNNFWPSRLKSKGPVMLGLCLVWQSLGLSWACKKS